MVAGAWNDIKESTIVNCFCKSGFVVATGNECLDNEDNTGYLDSKFCELSTFPGGIPGSITARDSTSTDDDVQACGNPHVASCLSSTLALLGSVTEKEASCCFAGAASFPHLRRQPEKGRQKGIERTTEGRGREPRCELPGDTPLLPAAARMRPRTTWGVLACGLLPWCVVHGHNCGRS